MVSGIKSLARSVLPQRVRNFIRYCASPGYRDRMFWEADRKRGEMVFEKTGGRVVAGPFRGLRYVATARGSSIGPKLLGTYELELHGVVEWIIARGYSGVINVGAGEGYYAVGLAQRMPGARFVCFDAEASNQDQIRTLAALNGVERSIAVRGFCDHPALADAIGSSRAGDVLVICDIEGGEVELLRPDVVPGLGNADVLVEMHDIIRRGCSKAVRGRFSASHDIEVIATRKRRPADFPANVELDAGKRLACMDEGRGAVMTFLWMRARK